MIFIQWGSKLWTTRFTLIQITNMLMTVLWIISKWLFDKNQLVQVICWQIGHHNSLLLLCHSTSTTQKKRYILKYWCKKHGDTLLASFFFFLPSTIMHVWICQHQVADKSLKAGVLVKVQVVEGIVVVYFQKCGGS